MAASPQSLRSPSAANRARLKQAREIVQSISVDSKPAVDEVADKVKRAGGTLIGEPKELPFGYAFGFSDPDGHVWSVLWMPQGN